MNRRAVLASYSVVAISAASLAVSRLPYGYGYYGSSISYDNLIGSTITVLAVAGLLLGPYFGLAGFIVREKSVWAEASRLIHQHISVPFIGAIFLFYGSLVFPLSVLALVSYGVFVFLATLIGVMANRAKNAASSTPQPSPSLADIRTGECAQPSLVIPASFY